MPSGKTHDLVTLLLGPPTAAGAYYVTQDWGLTGVTTAAMIFGGLMFGPDLDVQSRQYTRWGPLRFLWWPYKVLMPHRSRWSHSITLGTWLRVIYFLLVVTLLLAGGLLARDVYVRGAQASWASAGDALWRVWELFAPIPRDYLIATLAGLWVGATSHTVTDVLGSFFKSVRKSL